MKEKIRTAALHMFDRHGFYRTGIRDIAGEAGCALPTLYYYYPNKTLLYETIVCEAYETLCGQMADQLPEGLGLLDTYYYTVMQQGLLSQEDKLVLRLAFRLRMGLDGGAEARARVLRWEEARAGAQERRIRAEIDDPAFARLLLRVTDHMLQRIILYGEEPVPEEIRCELTLLFSVRSASS